MNIIDIIEKKKAKRELSKAEIEFFVNGFTSGEIADYQAAAFLMATVLNGMTDRETFDLTDAMLHSGDIVDMSKINGIVVDKHSTGGVGDSTTIALAPILACCGVFVAKMSGRGLGFTGGTIDKLESIPNFNTALTEERFFEVVQNVGCAVIGQTANLVPADKKLYALRDVTATIECIPLIASSIMSKKLASGADTILLDVKYGAGAFMKTKEEALFLAQKMVLIGTNAGRKIGALITDMEQPLSNFVGNTLEILGVLEVLDGVQNRLFFELREVAVRLLVLTGRHTKTTAEEAFNAVISSGRAKEKLCEMTKAQGGDATFIKNPQKFYLPQKVVLSAKSEGFVCSIDASKIGKAVMLLGGGRLQKDDKIDHSVGVVMKAEIGSFLKKGDAICEIFHNQKGLDEATQLLHSAVTIGADKPAPHKIAFAYVDKNGVEYY